MTGFAWRSAGTSRVAKLAASLPAGTLALAVGRLARASHMASRLRRWMPVIPGAVLACVLAACAAAAAPPAADGVARGPAPAHGGFSCRGQVPRHRSAKAYVVGHTALIPVDLATGKAGQPLPSPADPIAIAISRDGRTAYAGTSDSVVPIDVTNNAVGKPIATPAGAEAIAISPDGRTAYAAGSGGVTPIFLSTCTVGRVIATPGLDVLGPIAITPDGRTAYLAGYLESADGQTSTPGFLRVDLVRGVAGKFLPMPGMDAAAVAPDGRIGYVTGGPSVIPISLVTGKVGKPIKTPGLGGGSIAITPDGRTAYVGNLKPEAPDAGIVVPIDLAAGTAGKPIHVPSYPYSILDIAITANARTAYAVDLASVIPINLTTRKAARPITMTAGAYFIAITS
jgi:DNA-binding beta-propeller fold protein YncE